MDDPWGSSPWADETPSFSFNAADTIKPVIPQRQYGNDLGGSHWDEVDNFEEWAKDPVTREGSIGKASFDLENSLRYKEHGEEADDATYAEHRPAIVDTDKAAVIGRGSDEVLKGLQSDPWAEVEEGPGLGEEERIHSTHKVRRAQEERSDSEQSPGQAVIPNSIPSVASPGHIAIEYKSAPEASVSSKNGEDETRLNIKEDGRNTETRVQKASEVSTREQEQNHSRPSSLSDHEDSMPESPRTSFEEELKRPPLERKTSSKVKQLVQLFDNLKKVESGGSIASEPKMKSDATGEAGAYITSEVDFGDFGTFEDASMDFPELVEAAPIDNKLEEIQPVPTLNKKEGEEAHLQTAKPPSDVKFSVDMSIIEKLLSRPVATSQVEVADLTNNAVVFDSLQDSFSTIEQRKTWYRISRYGTMRKHNTGNDESYVWMNWAHSTVRMETLKIVARWMEQDRNNGRVVLGSGTKLGSVFGWGETGSEPPLTPISSPFSPRRFASDPSPPPKTLVHNAQISLLAHDGQKRSSLEIDSVSGTKPPHSGQVAPFGWSPAESDGGFTSGFPSPLPPPQSPALPTYRTSPAKISMPHIAPISAETAKPQFDRSRDLSLNAPVITTGQFGSAHSTPESQVLTSIHLNISSNKGSTDAVDIDDGSEWGEMISSPISLAKPQFSSAFNTDIGPSITPKKSLSLSSVETGNACTARAPFVDFSIDGTIPVPNSPAVAFPPPQAPTAQDTDPWASADFSLFETPVPSYSPSIHGHAPSLKQDNTTFSPPVQISTRAQDQKKAAQKHSSTQGPQSVLRSNQKSKVELEQEKIVQSIVQNLPDLSYMLRR